MSRTLDVVRPDFNISPRRVSRCFDNACFLCLLAELRETVKVIIVKHSELTGDVSGIMLLNFGLNLAKIQITLTVHVVLRWSLLPSSELK